MPAFLVAKQDSLKSGEMKTVAAGDKQVLLCNVGGNFYAVHHKCSHYGAPLEDGVLNGFRLVCPWHHACFDARTGRHLEAPGCDGLASYPVELRDSEVWVRIEEADTVNHPPNAMVKGGATAELPYVVLGGGPAGAQAVEGLREGGYEGPITLISSEKHLPYDRTQLTKGFLAGDTDAQDLPLRDLDFYQE